MFNLLPFAIAAMVAALLFYTIGVWSERFSGRLKTWHLVMFWFGLVFDTTGTTLMGKIAGQFSFDIHAVTGLLAIVLMLSHAVWASVVLIKKNEKAILSFHKFSVLVWLIWLVPFITGLVIAMG